MAGTQPQALEKELKIQMEYQETINFQLVMVGKTI